MSGIEVCVCVCVCVCVKDQVTECEGSRGKAAWQIRRRGGEADVVSAARDGSTLTACQIDRQMPASPATGKSSHRPYSSPLLSSPLLSCPLHPSIPPSPFSNLLSFSNSCLSLSLSDFMSLHSLLTLIPSSSLHPPSLCLPPCLPASLSHTHQRCRRKPNRRRHLVGKHKQPEVSPRQIAAEPQSQHSPSLSLPHHTHLSLPPLSRSFHAAL